MLTPVTPWRVKRTSLQNYSNLSSLDTIEGHSIDSQKKTYKFGHNPEPLCDDSHKSTTLIYVDGHHQHDIILRALYTIRCH